MNKKFFVLMCTLVFCALMTAVSQPPTRVYGPAYPAAADARTIRSDYYHSYWFFNPGDVRFGQWAPTQNYLYGFMCWRFSQSTLPPGSTVRQVKLTFNRVVVPSYHHTDHASFWLYDVKLEPTVPDDLKAALNSTNYMFGGTTWTTTGGVEMYETTDASLMTAVESALTSGRNFITIGVKRNPEYYSDWSEDWQISEGWPLTAALQVWFEPPQYSVQFKNDLDEASYGTITVDGNTINSGASLPFYWGDQTTVTAYTGRYQYNSNNWKYRTWDIGDPNYNQNPKTFTIIDTRPITAYFKPVFDVTVRNDFEGTDAGQLTYQGNQVNSGHSEQDVFQEEQRAFSAITPQTYNGVVYNFYQWSDGVASPSRNVPITSTTTFQAKFKAALASTNQLATGPTGQRKIVQQVYPPGTGYYLTYISSGDVWYTKSTDGVNWTPEILASRGTGTASNPSIADMGFYQDTTYIVWVDTTVASGEVKHTIFFRKLSMNTGQLQQIERIQSEGYWARADAAPVAVRLGAMPNFPDVTVAFEAEKSGIVMSHRYYYGSNGIIWWTTPVTTSTSAARPSMCLSYDDLPCNVSLAFEEDGNVYLAVSNVAHPYPVLFGTPEEVSTEVSLSDNRSAVIDLPPVYVPS